MRFDGRRRVITFTEEIEHTLTKRATLLAYLKFHVDISFTVSGKLRFRTPALNETVGILRVDLLQVQNGEHPCITVSPVAMSISFVQLLTSAVLLLIA